MLANLIRIQFSIFFLLVSFGAQNVASQDSSEKQATPNILWISIEDMTTTFGAYGDSLVDTPVIDKLADEGVLFTRAFSTSGVCSPSRTAIITGVHQSSIGAHHHRPTTRGHENRTSSLTEPLVKQPTPYQVVPPPYIKTFTEYLRKSGYYTTNNSKTDYNFGVPVSAWDESSQKAHWRNAPEGQPFFSVINLTTTHESRIWLSETPLTVDPDSVTVPPYLPDTPRVRRDIAQQYTNIEKADIEIGEILAELERDGLADNTVVFFWSDHGGTLPRQKSWLYDSGIHVPLIIRWPGKIEPGTINEEMVSLIDLAPTVLSIADVDVPSHMQGRVIAGPGKEKAPRFIYAAADRHDEIYDMMRAVRDGRFKYIRNYFPGQPYLGMNEYRHRMDTFRDIHRLLAEGKLEGAEMFWAKTTRPPEELYDTSSDPHEINNLAEDPAFGDVLQRMRKELNDWMLRIGDMGHVPEEQLRERFWPGGVQPVTDAPYFVVNSEEDRAMKWRREGGEFTEPYLVNIVSTTHGASIVYTTEVGDDFGWQIYSGPIRIDEPVTIRAKAIRYGYSVSDEVSGTFRIKE